MSHEKVGQFHACDHKHKERVKLDSMADERTESAGDPEKGALVDVQGNVQEYRKDGRRAGLGVYHKIVASVAIFYFLIWKYGILHSSPPTSRPSNITGVPSYVLDYAPLVWLDTAEQYFPSDISAQVDNTHPDINYTTIKHHPKPLTLFNLDLLNEFGNNGLNVFLTSAVDVTTSPIWLDGIVPDTHGKTNGATSCAIIINDHSLGHVDVFYMYFYAFNLGNTVLFNELGDHIGDWEHNMIRFDNGIPTHMWFSQHAGGQAFTYEALEKIGLRPITYSAMGSHANYATPGTHDHTIPGLNLPAGFLQDYTSHGTLWDPTLASYFYNYSADTEVFKPINQSPLGAMHYRGKWGDQQYPADDRRQKIFLGFPKYVGGPTGPWDKQLNRTLVCPTNGIPCVVKEDTGPFDSTDE